MNSILFSSLAGFVNTALLYWVSPLAALIALMVESVALFCLITKRTQWAWAGLAYVGSSVWALVHFLAAISHQIPLSWQNRPLQLDAHIISMVASNAVKQTFTVQAARLCLKDYCLKVDAKIELNAYTHAKTKALPFKPGQRWLFYARLKRVHRLANPSALHVLEWAKGEYAAGSVLNYPTARLLQPAPVLNINGLRQKLAQQIRTVHLNDDSSAIIGALTLGDRSHLSSALWLLFQKTGVLHLMAISGLHVGLVATFVYGLMYLLLWPFPKLFHTVPRQKIAMWAAMCIAWSYGALAGFAVSTVRACIMISLYVLAKSVSRQMSWLSVLLWSSVCILIFAPLQSLNISFWLSFIAVYSIAFLMWIFPKGEGLKQHLRMQVALSACLLPFSLLFFQRSPLNAPLANLLAIPWVSFIILPGALLALILQGISPLLAHPIFIALQWNIDYLLYFLREMVQLFPYQWWHGGGLLGLGLMGGGLLLALLPRAWQLRGLAIIWLLLAFIPVDIQPKPPPLRVTIFDVGQGLAILLQTRHHTLLYDTGPSYYGGGDAATSAILPFLKRQAQANLDMMVVSHQDADHSGGVPTLLKQLPGEHLITSTSQSPFVKRVYADKNFLEAALFNPQHALQLSQCVEGQQWRWDSVDFRFLSPKAGVIDQKDNNSSCVLVVTVAGHRLLLTGDIEARVEAQLVETASAYFPDDVLVAPHHGSSTSSSQAFVSAVQPKIVIFSTGYFNRYHFPARNIQKRYQTAGALAYNTADNGAVSFSFGEQGEMSAIRTVRQESAWQHFLEKIYAHFEYK